MLYLDSFTANGTWTKRAGAKWVRAIVVGGGAGGGGGYGLADGNTRTGGGGGGGGAIVIRDFHPSVLGATETVTVAASASGGANQSNGSTSSASSFGSHVSAYGGGGGRGDTIPPGRVVGVVDRLLLDRQALLAARVAIPAAALLMSLLLHLEEQVPRTTLPEQVPLSMAVEEQVLRIGTLELLLLDCLEDNLSSVEVAEAVEEASLLLIVHLQALPEDHMAAFPLAVGVQLAAQRARREAQELPVQAPVNAAMGVGVEEV